MKTAVEWLQAEFNKWAAGKVFIPQDILEQAKKIEKEQIIEAYINGYGVSFIDDDNRNFSRPQEYYNQTYNLKKS